MSRICIPWDLYPLSDINGANSCILALIESLLHKQNLGLFLSYVSSCVHRIFLTHVSLFRHIIEKVLSLVTDVPLC